MNKKHIKFLFVLLTVFIMFLVNKNVVNAASLQGCYADGTHAPINDSGVAPCNLSGNSTPAYYTLFYDQKPMNEELVRDMCHHGLTYNNKPIWYYYCEKLNSNGMCTYARIDPTSDMYKNALNVYEESFKNNGTVTVTNKDTNQKETCVIDKDSLNEVKSDSTIDDAQKEKYEQKYDEERKKYVIRRVNPENPNTNTEVDTQIKCEDVKVFHTIYMVMIILAPILVIVLGTIDFAQAVVASDEKKMQEFKGRFPKRLTALIILVLVPIIIKLILAFINLNSGLMECIING